MCLVTELILLIDTLKKLTYFSARIITLTRVIYTIIIRSAKITAAYTIYYKQLLKNSVSNGYVKYSAVSMDFLFQMFRHMLLKLSDNKKLSDYK